MKEQEINNVKDIILLDDNRKYIILKKKNEYYLLMSDSEPLNIMVGKIENNKFVVANDKEIIEEILK